MGVCVIDIAKKKKCSDHANINILNRSQNLILKEAKLSLLNLITLFDTRKQRTVLIKTNFDE